MQQTEYHLLHAGILSISLLAANSAQAALVINEIDYDQPGSDDAEFIELYNSGAGAMALDNVRIELINGNNDSSYRQITLDGFAIGAGGYFVICNSSGLVANCNHEFTASGGWIQNGAPDAVALFDGISLLDSLSYEGTMAGFTETSSPAFADSNTDIMSLARLPDGIDSHNNRLDFFQACITPGSANIAGKGDCSIATSPPVASPVPLPAAAWLFGSGLLGLGMVSRVRFQLPDEDLSGPGAA